jgi:hypothetical protein
MNGGSSIGELVIGPIPAGVWGATRPRPARLGIASHVGDEWRRADVGGRFPACVTTAMVAADAAVIIGREAALRLRC